MAAIGCCQVISLPQVCFQQLMCYIELHSGLKITLQQAAGNTLAIAGQRI